MQLQPAIFAIEEPQINAGQGAIQPIRRLSGRFQRFPGHFQDQPLLRIHLQRLTGRDTKEAGVEIGHIVQETTPTGTDFARLLRIGIKIGAGVPALRWHFGHAVTAITQHLPERLRAVGPLGKAAAHADNGNRFGLGLLQPVQFVLQLLNGQESLFEW